MGNSGSDLHYRVRISTANIYGHSVQKCGTHATAQPPRRTLEIGDEF